ncbi:MAG: SRPBCC family protein [Candidatus Eremiobacteraeota bacterium]|nr:SRPBCC family protein [Candidatus Eremiobacteraeota bacterium]
MSELRDTIVIDAPAQRIYALASDTARWADYLPHYRFVRVLARNGESQTVEMAARRDVRIAGREIGLPVRWTAQQRNDPAAPAIYFEHLTGWTKGMRVVWRFESLGDQTRVSIDHDVRFASPIASEWLARHVAGQFFIHDIAGKTLARMKLLAERADG